MDITPPLPQLLRSCDYIRQELLKETYWERHFIKPEIEKWKKEREERKRKRKIRCMVRRGLRIKMEKQ